MKLKTYKLWVFQHKNKIFIIELKSKSELLKDNKEIFLF